MRRSQKDFLYLIGSLGFAVLCLSDLKNSWKMFLFLLAFAGLNFYNYTKHKRNEEKWDDYLDDMYDEDDDDRRKTKNKDKDRFDSYIRSIEKKFDFEEDEDEEDDEI